MTIEAKLDTLIALTQELVDKFAHIGAATRVPQGASQQNKSAEPAKPAAPKAPEQKGDLNYEKDIKPIALALAKKDRAALTKIWTELGVKVGTELKPEQFAKAKQLIEAA